MVEIIVGCDRSSKLLRSWLQIYINYLTKYVMLKPDQKLNILYGIPWLDGFGIPCHEAVVNKVLNIIGKEHLCTNVETCHQQSGS